jgi:hypothetical protein
VAPAAPPWKRKTAGSSPTKRTLELLRREGYSAAVVERFNTYAKVRVDLFGFGDVLAIRPDCPGVLAVQATTTDNQAGRLRKALAIPELKVWVAAGNRVEIWGWRKNGRSGRWEVTRRPVAVDTDKD